MNRVDAALRNREIRTSSDQSSALAARFGLSTAQVSRIRSTVGRPTTSRQRFEQVAAGAWRADCMTDEEWTDWVAMNPIGLTDTQVADRPCTDCPLGFAAEMRALGKCNGTPGWQPPAEDHEEAAVGDTITMARVAVNPPCGRCAHEPVCAIKRSLDGLTEAEVSIPKPDPAITVRVTLDVDCSQFLRAARPKRELSPAQLEAARATAAAMRERMAAKRASQAAAS